MIDLDLQSFGYDDDKLVRSLKETLVKVKGLLQGFKPTVLMSGNGYHVYIPINNKIVLEYVSEFADIEHVSTKFLRFAEWYLSAGKSDSVHNNTVSLKNCMLRIPGTYNSKNDTQIRIINRWDTLTKIADINLLIGSFMAYLTGQRLKEEESKRRQERKYYENLIRLDYNYLNNYKASIHWIEILFRTPFHDHRKYAIWRILAPYLLNVKRLSYDQAYDTINSWLDRCNVQRRLDFNPNTRIKEGLNGAKKGYLPIRFEKLRKENNDLYNLLERKKVNKDHNYC
jgi:hypothetical protein